MQFFLDTANLREIETGLGWGMVDGVTTNPTLIAREGKPYLPTVAEIARLVPGPVRHARTDLPGMLDEGRRLAGLAPNVVVKVPLTPTGLAAVRAFAAEQIRCNVTLCFSAAQALLAAKAGAAYVSPFVGRLDDVGESGMRLIGEIVEIYGNYPFETRSVASVRHLMHAARPPRSGPTSRRSCPRCRPALLPPAHRHRRLPFLADGRRPAGLTIDPGCRCSRRASAAGSG